jgi:hypothetical protein
MSTRDARLGQLGMTYREYLESEHWANLKRRYRASNLPQMCLGCNDPRVQMHHRTYQRIGREELTDIIPLCKACHDKVHDYCRGNSMHVKDTHAVMRVVFGWSKKQMMEKFKPYRLSGRPNGCALTPKRRKMT